MQSLSTKLNRLGRSEYSPVFGTKNYLLVRYTASIHQDEPFVALVRLPTLMHLSFAQNTVQEVVLKDVALYAAKNPVQMHVHLRSNSCVCWLGN